ncbi:bifunctional isocitrate dehydrogenase kinase/phosphatase [Chryseotalea sanaruensis]|uniref:Bifunctional isocitrate dehydrogenase kinase/phosphatase n=1 Tax=Chryseotalea sanaruensis TaxID=2482724 RepID=A0A401UDJ2_9BACT|nr:bifunctional isocitrate dehydrogenase kinase/phosphatase [Chryseotalea sanaruensis]GCC52912.1 bifunctional isocitrate dehydrogenase kinase/phosphatase [Chryseotalea sanaruensis]
MTNPEVADALINGFNNFRIQFNTFSHSANIRFEKMQWHEQRRAIQQRMELHEFAIDSLAKMLQTQIDFGKIDWDAVSRIFVTSYLDDSWLPMAISFHNAIIRQAFAYKGLQHIISIPSFSEFKQPVSIYQVTNNLYDTLAKALKNFELKVGFIHFERETQLLVKKIETDVSEKVLGLVFHKNLFFRNKQAYAVGKIQGATRAFPITIAMQVSEAGASIKGLLLDEESIKNIFSFSRSYFLVNSESPCGTVNFLLSVMPSKPRAQLLINLGYQDLGKELLLQNMYRKMQSSDAKFTHAPGIAGMVMFVFYHPASNYVFKVVRGNIKPPKNTTEKEVFQKYRFVAEHDRVGRLADVQNFKNLALPEKWFDTQLKNELLAGAPASVGLESGYLIFRTVFIERKLEPLNLYLQHHSDQENKEVILDYGKAIKEMAYTNIFPGDLLIKNFGVTTNKKIVFYDYDEVVPLSDCTFRVLRKPRYDEEEYFAEYQDVVLENDIFPEELLKFLLPEGPLRDTFLENYPELFSVDFWNEWKEFHLKGAFIDLHPYNANITPDD